MSRTVAAPGGRLGSIHRAEKTPKHVLLLGVVILVKHASIGALRLGYYLSCHFFVDAALHV